MTLRQCVEPGCSTLTRLTRCPLHHRLHERQRAQPYQDQIYRQARRAALDAEPWCHTAPSCPYPDRGTPANPLTADHIVPLAWGGRNVRSNMQTMCRACNSAKRDRLLRSRG